MEKMLLRFSSSAVQSVLRLFVATGLVLGPCLACLAQEGVIQGQVTEAETEEPLPGVNIIVVGQAGLGAATDGEGRYVIEGVPAGEQQLEARFVGYRRQAVTVDVAEADTLVQGFELQPSFIEMDELVVSVSAGDLRRREVGTDIAAINVNEAIEGAAITDFSSLLNARASNVSVNATSGNVGGGSSIRVRGINSLTQDNSPLLIIDGVRVNNDTEVGVTRGQTYSRFNDINPQDIASLQIVKGPAATALYGSEAAAGVIVVETKSGVQGRTRFTFQTEQGTMTDVTTYPDNYADVTAFGITDPNDPILAPWRTAQNEMTGEVFVLDNPFEDADSSPFRRGQFSTYNMAVSGGAQNFNYYSSLNYETREGVLPSNFLDRLSFRANFEATPAEAVRIRANSGYTRSEANLPKSGNNTSGYFANAIDGIPISALGEDGSCLATVLGASDPSFCDKNGNTRAAFDKIEPILSAQDIDRFTASLQTDITPYEWWTSTIKMGADVTDMTFTDAIPYDPDVPFSFAEGGENFITRPLTRVFTADASTQVSYPLTSILTGHTALGAQYFNNRIETISCEGRIFPNDQATACDAAVSLRGFSDLSENVEVGAYVQQRMDYRDFLFVTGSLRVDDNSALGADEGAIWSPSVNTSILLSEMPFWNVPRFDELQLRFAWGTASQSPSQYAANRTYVITRLAQEGNIVAGLSPLDPGNPDLGPERSQEFELGFNASFFDYRLGVNFTYFDRTTRDAIISRPVAPSLGFANNRFINIGRLENSGLEFSIDALIMERENITWDARLQLSTVHPIVADLGIDEPIFTGVSQVIQTGFAPGAYYGRVITSAERDADGNIIPESVQYAPGNLEEGSDFRILGQPTPTNEQSLSTTLTLFKRITLTTLFDRKGGHQLFNGLSAGRNPGILQGASSRFGEEWAYRQIRMSPEEQATIELDELEGNHDAFWVEDADFVKWRELKVSYTLPPRLMGRVGASRAQVYVGGRNLYTWTNFSGLDPEARDYGARDDLRANVDNALPAPRMFFTGVSLTF